MATLYRAGGGSLTWSAASLNGLLASLRAAGQVRSYSGNGVAYLAGGAGLLIVDAAWHVGLRLSEQFEVQTSSGAQFGVSFSSDGAAYTLDQALLASGYVGAVPPPSLAAVHMAFYDTGGGSYVVNVDNEAGVSLFNSSGLFGAAPAQFRRLRAGAGVSLQAAANNVTVSAVPADVLVARILELSEYLQLGAGFKLSFALAAGGVQEVYFDSSGPVFFRVTTGGVQRTPLSFGSDARCAINIGTIRNNLDAAVLTVAPNSVDAAFSGLVSGRLASFTDFTVTNAGNTPVYLVSQTGGSSLSMYALNAERWILNCLGGNQRFSLGRVQNINGGRVESDVLRVDYGTGDLTCFGHLTLGSFGLPMGLSVWGTSVLQALTCDSLTVNGQPFTGEATNAVLYVAQTLTTAQQTAARTNIGAISVVTDANVSATAAIQQSKISGLTASLAGKVDTTDPRLSDTRAPTAGSVVNASVSATAAIAQSKIANLVADLAGKIATGDSRLNDSRVPLDGSVIDASVSPSAAIQQSKILNLTTDLAGKLGLAGGALTGPLTATSLTAAASLGAGGNVTLTVNNTGASGFSSLYLTAPSETAQLYVGQGTGLAIRTNTAHPIVFAPNAVTALTLSSAGVANFAQTPTAGGTALVKTDDARLTDQRAPADGTVTTAKLADGAVTTAKIADGAVTPAKLSTAYLPLAGGTMTGALNAHAGLSIRGAKGSNSPATPGVLIGRDTSGAGNTAMELTCQADQLSYIDMGAVNVDYSARIICTPASSRIDIQSVNIGFTGIVTTSGNVTVGGVLAGASATFTGVVACTRITASQQPHTVVIRAGAFSIPAGGPQIVAFESNIEARSASSFVFNGAGRVTVNVAGVYIIVGRVSLVNSNTLFTQLLLNGTSIAENADSTGSSTISEITAVRMMSVGNYVEMTAWHASGSAQAGQPGAGYTSLSLTMLS